MCCVDAGPYGKGKSYILSEFEAFDKPKVFPLEHHFDPETVRIRIWIVPQKMRVGSHFFDLLLITAAESCSFIDTITKFQLEKVEQFSNSFSIRGAGQIFGCVYHVPLFLAY